MEKLKMILSGPAGRFGLGGALGAIIARTVDGGSLGEIFGLGLALGVIFLVIHSLIINK